MRKPVCGLIGVLLAACIFLTSLSAEQREVEYRHRRSDLPWFSRVVIVRATFDVQFYREGSMRNGRNVYSYYLVRESPWSPWLIADWTSQP